jgi:hypothetical protein
LKARFEPLSEEELSEKELSEASKILAFEIELQELGTITFNTEVF